MPPIATYVFLDFGTTGLLNQNPEITELHMSAVTCQELRKFFKDEREKELGEAPDVINLHCRIEDGVMWFLGNEHRDPEECVLADEIAGFLNDLEKPLCLIAYNGPKFDFKLLKSELADAERFSKKGILCADAMAAFYDILERDPDTTSYDERVFYGAFPWPYQEGRKSYRFEEVCKRELSFQPVPFNPEVRNKVMMRIALRSSFEFMLWVAENNYPFSGAKSQCKEYEDVFKIINGL